jgi:hypothetical protein
MSQKLALLGGKPVRTRPFTSWPIFGKTEEKRTSQKVRVRQQKWIAESPDGQYTVTLKVSLVGGLRYVDEASARND